MYRRKISFEREKGWAYAIARKPGVWKIWGAMYQFKQIVLKDKMKILFQKDRVIKIWVPEIWYCEEKKLNSLIKLVYEKLKQ